MTRFSFISLAAFLIFSPLGAVASASGENIEIAQSACQSVGQMTAANAGATLLAATETTLNGAPACEVVMLMPAGNGERPRREVVVVPR